MPSRRSIALLALLALLAASLLAGCGGGEGETPPKAKATPTTTKGGPLRVDGDKPKVETVATGLDVPWEMAFLPDGSALITERPGNVRLLGRDGRLREAPVGKVRVTATGESGLLGVAVDPRFRRNRFVYLYRTLDGSNGVVRYRYEDGRLRDPEVLFDSLDAAEIHDGGRIKFGPDGALYIGTGDAGPGGNAQDPKTLNGKLLRLARPAGKPAEPEIYSSGHRNVQGFDWDARGRLFATEFGENDHDEINLIRKGRNYGWPIKRGAQGGEGFTPAIVDYEDVIAPSGATFVHRKGSSWTGDFVFANLISEQLRRVSFKGTKATRDEPLYEGDFGRLRTVVEGPNGALYVLTNNRDGRGSEGKDDDKILRLTLPRG